MWRVLAGHEDDPKDSVLALRLMGAVHRRVLEGRAAPFAGETDPWPAFVAVVERDPAALRALVERPVQTNEVGRSLALLAGFLHVAAATRLPLRLLEVGASGGLNLRWDRYRLDLAHGRAWGDPESAVVVHGDCTGPPPPLGAPVAVAERAGCDREPVDVRREDGRVTLLSYVWADQHDRLRLAERAIALARDVPVRLDRAAAGDWLPARLDEPAHGRATVVFHSIVTQYLAAGEREALRAAIEAAGRRAAAAAPLAWLRMEPAGAHAEVRLTTWPGGGERLLATAGFHGRPVRWT